MRLIDADRFYNVLNDLGGCGAKPESYADGWDKAIDNVISQLEDTPTIEAEPVRHGKWVYKCNDELDDIPYCSICDEPDALSRNDYEYRGGEIRDNNSNYCPNCGAKMRGKK